MRRGGGKEPYRIPRRPVSGSANSGRSGGAKVHRINAAHTAASTAAPATCHTGDATCFDARELLGDDVR